METQQKTPIGFIFKFLPWIEMFGLVLLAIAIILTLIKLPGDELLMVSMATLATVFFLYAQAPPEARKDEDAPFGFKELLANVIAPKVFWISTSVCTIGILFYALGFQKITWQQMLLIGAPSLAISILLQATFFIGGTPARASFQSSLLRGMPILVIALYLLLKSF